MTSRKESVQSGQTHIQDQESIFVLRSKVENCELQNRSHSPGKVLMCACAALFLALCLYLFLKSLFVDVILRQQRGPQDLQAYLSEFSTLEKERVLCLSGPI